MNQINRKVYRDLGRMKMQVISIALVLAAGVAALISFLSTHDSLKAAQSRFYHESRFADVFADLKRAPLNLERRLAAIPGVVSLETRIVKDFLLHIPDRVDSAVGRFISFPESGEPHLNHLYLREGRMLDPSRSDEVLVSEGFALANHFKPGDSIAAIVNGKFKKFHVVGTVLSPEYIFAMRGEVPVPDDRQFGIFWTSRKGLEAALDMEGSFNSLSLILGPGSSVSRVKERLDDTLDPYGGLGAYDRSDQVSHRFVSDEINQNKVMAVAIPLIFLMVAAFLLHVVITRLVGMQRTQIATLKALGYSNTAIFLHYFKMIGIIVLLGSALGCGVGIWLGRELTVLYTEYYHFPHLIYVLTPSLVILAVGISFATALFGVVSSLRQVFRLQPAEAMRPPVPPAFHENIWERLGVTRFLSNSGKMVYRNLTLRPWRTALSIFGIAFAVMITTLGLFWWDTIHYLIYSQFQLTQREDVQVVFTDHLPERSLNELQKLPGVLATEAYRWVPVRLGLKHREVETVLMAYPRNSRMRLLLDKDMKKISLPPEGLLLSHLLARKLRARPGDLLEVKVQEGKRQKWRLPVAGIAYQWVGYAAYLGLDKLQELLSENTISTANLDIDLNQKIPLQRQLKELPTVAAVNFKKHVLDVFQKTIVRFLLVFATVLTLFALVIAVGVVYNSARVSLSERAWELMSLRVLGFSKRDVFRLLSREISIQLVGSLPVGCLLGYGFAALLVRLMHTETLDFPLVVTSQTFAYASLVVVVSGILSIWTVKRHLDRMNLVTALKVRE